MLTVIIPVYNEEKTVDELLRRVQRAPYAEKQTIVVDDGSTDGTSEILTRWERKPGFLVLRHEKNRGKGTAIRTALPHVLGEITIVQDADLEYDPAEYPLLIEPLLARQSPVVYGSRYMAPRQTNRWSRFRIAVLFLNRFIWFLYGRQLSDVMTCYKALQTELLRSMGLESRGFDFCAEVTAKLCRLRIPIMEVAISYSPRNRRSGKKIGWRDVAPIVWSLLKWRFLTVSCARTSMSNS